jgi:formyltetrahydrofolate-dependent phosphoribosylglycinamide formyltransferase
MSQTQLARIAVLVSGNGTNLQAIMDACQNGTLQAKVVVVAANRSKAFGLERAANAGIPTLLKEKTPQQDRTTYDRELSQALAAFEPDWVVLAGWMRLLSQAFLDQFPARVVNIHPALPGTFPGTHAIERAFQAFQNGEILETGVMVHFVPDEGVDCGPVICQESITIDPTDTLETLETRVHALEHKLFVQSLIQLCNPAVTA